MTILLPRESFRRSLAALLVIIVLSLAATGLWIWRKRQARYDLAICGARIFDGDRWRPEPCVAVSHGRIARIGSVYDAWSERYLTVHGQVLAPGFIDTHGHVEANIPTSRPFLAPNFVQMGVTTLITGNCGSSRTDLREMFAALERNGSEINLASLVGHNSIRTKVMGAGNREARPDEIRRMCDLVAGNMQAGALGLSTGLAYSPGCFASEHEVAELARTAARYHGRYVTHLRDEGIGGRAALAEALRIGADAGVPVHISHFKVADQAQWGQAPARLAMLDAAQAKGERVSLDVYPYTASSTSLDIMMPPAYRGRYALWHKAMTNPVERQKLTTAMLAQLHQDGFPDYAFARIAYFQRDHSLEGLSIPQVAARKHRGRAGSLQEQAETVLSLLADGGAQMVYFSMSESDVKAILHDPRASIGSDSSVRTESNSFFHPRGSGNTARLLGRYVREQQVLTLEDALRKLTSVAADTFSLAERGRIKVGWPADLTLFDPSKIADRSTYESPVTPPIGVTLVLVNGVPVLDRGELTGANPGVPIRGP